MFTFDINMKSCIFAHFNVISLVYLFMFMHISFKAYNRCTQETFLKGSDLDVNMFSELRSIPSVTIYINLRSCVLKVCLPSQFVICRNLWSRACRDKFSPITLKMCSAYLGEYPCSLWTGIWEAVFWPISVLFAISIVYNSPYIGCRNEPMGCV